ncbi:glycoside hydrolase family 43 protein [Sinomonas humi]|uniref:Glycoside hydrolase n=1 Tax=Sinomonas humi TaxID=1338436 RepID=A0A0B2ALB5_9MICC|nr:glycoside hydrolase family 43 protein [Sinomonas humi]KHL04121.1 glycoside hydrolase [Sinomonas humi]
MNPSPLTNPSIPGFNPDPTCVFVEGFYYAVTSSFEYLPGLPVYRSTDLMAWEHIGNVATRQGQVELGGVPSGSGVWAPTLRYRDGVYYVIVAIADSPRGCVVFTASDPAGPWDGGTAIDGIDGIDPDLAWDEEGAAYVTFGGHMLKGPETHFHHGILQAKVDLAAGRALEAPRRLWSGTGKTAPEAPHLYERDGVWYLIIAEGGTGRGHSVSIARGRSIEGPFTGFEGNPVLTSSGTSNQVVAVGHADLVSGPEGDIMLVLGNRTVDNMGAFSPIGRETFATRVTWSEGWPIPEPVHAAPAPADFLEVIDLTVPDALADPGWLAVGRLPSEIAEFDAEASATRITALGGGLGGFRPDFIGRRQRHLECAVEATLNVDHGAGGLALRFDERSFIELTAERWGLEVLVRARAVSPSAEQQWVLPASGPSARLQIAVERPEPGTTAWSGSADRLRLSTFDGDGVLRTLAVVDGRSWSVEVAAPFTGRILGLVATRGQVDVMEFRYWGRGNS